MVDQFNVEKFAEWWIPGERVVLSGDVRLKRVRQAKQAFCREMYPSLQRKPAEEIQDLLQNIQRQSAGEACVLTIIRFQ